MSANIKYLLTGIMLTASATITPAFANSGGFMAAHEQALLVFSIGLGLPILFIVFMNSSSVTFTKLPKDEGFNKFLERSGYKGGKSTPKQTISAPKPQASNSRLGLKAQKQSGPHWKAQK